MADGDDLPDRDYESIYGADALDARRRARLHILEQTVQDLVQSYEDSKRYWQQE